jgi:hypothetical protein
MTANIVSTAVSIGNVVSTTFPLYLVVLDTQGYPLFLVPKTLNESTMACCLQCGMSKHLYSNDKIYADPIEKFSKYFYHHCQRSNSKSSKEHVTARLPSLGGIKEQLTEIFGSDQRLPRKPQGNFIEISTFLSFPTLAKDRMLEHIKICGLCFSPKQNVSACCASSAIDGVPAYVRSGCCPLLVLDGETELSKFRNLKQLSITSPSKRKDLEQQVFTGDDASPTPFPDLRDAGDDNKRLKVGRTIHKDFFPRTSNGANEVVLRNDDGNILVLRFETTTRSGDFYRMAIGSEQTLPGMGQGEIRIWRAIQGATVLPTLEKALRYSVQFPPLNLSDGFHLMIYSAVKELYDTSQKDIESGVCTPFMLTFISKLPVSSSIDQLGSVSGTRYMEGRVTPYAEFSPSLSTVSSYTTILTRLLLGVVNNKMLGFEILQEAIDQIQSDNEGNPDPISQWNLMVLRTAVFVFLRSISTNPHDISTLYLTSFIFQQKKENTFDLPICDDDCTILEGNVEEDDVADEDDDEEAQDNTDHNLNEENPNLILKFASAATIEKCCNALLHWFKRVAIIRMCEMIEQNTKKSFQMCVLQELIEEYRNTPVLGGVAKIIYNLNQLVPSTGNDRNITQFETIKSLLRLDKNRFATTYILS